MTREEWTTELRLLTVKRRRAAWDLAWLLVRGRREGLADADFANAAAATGYSRAHCHNLFRVGLAFPKEKAHPDLPFSVHRELLREPDETQRALVFAKAIEERWTAEDAVRYFADNPPTRRPYVGEDQPAGKANRAPYNRKYYVGAHVECPNCHERFPVKGHKVTTDAVATEVVEERGREARGGEPE